MKDNKYCYFCIYRHYSLEQDEDECLLQIREKVRADDIACKDFKEGGN